MRAPRVLEPPAGRWPVALASALLVLGLSGPARAARPPGVPRAARVFAGDMIHFLPDSADRYAGPGLVNADNGRRIRRRVDFGRDDRPARLVAHLVLAPVPKTEASVCDPWDRAGSVRLRRPGRPDLEVVKFMTSYGGATTHDVDVTELAPALAGDAELEAFIDTWVTPGWRVDLSLERRPLGAPATPLEATFDSAAAARAPRRVTPLFCEDDWTAARNDSLALPRPVRVAAGTTRVVLRLLTSGHCTDGRDDDEFVTKEHVVLVDGRAVERFRPWRDDCRRFRDLNPYGRRWSDGSWSSDYARSGWCPGQAVTPREIDLTAALPPGEHTVALRIDGIRPRGADGHLGYWRVSAALLEYE
jgi:hypothetical protein